MKIQNLLFGMLACGSLIACTNNDLVDEGANNFEGVNAYMGVRIALPSEGATGRATDDGYANGSAGEQAISNIYFAFYNDNGDFIVDGETVSKDITPTPSQPNGSVEAIADAVVALKTDEIFPTQVVAYVNIPDAKATFTGLSISQAMAKATDTYKNGDKFIMTNSTYLNGTNIACGTQVTTNSFYESEDMAKQNAVPVYVERLAAKVAVSESASMSITPVVDAAGNKLQFVLEGYALNGLNKESYYLKNIQNWNVDFTTPDKWSTAWNVAANFRSFWAEDPNYSDGTYPKVAADITVGDALKYVSFNEVVANDKEAEYCLENTLTNALFADNYYPACTHVLLVGHYTITDKNDAVVNLKDFYYYADQVYSEADIVKLLASSHAVYTKETRISTTTGLSEDVYTALKPEDYKIVRAEKQGAEKVTIALVAESGTFYKVDATATDGFSPYTDIAEANAAVLDKAGTAEAFKDSKAYFAVPIEHFGKEGVDGHYGVVRNHYYDLKISSIKSLGVGIYDPDEAIVPHPDEKTYYVGTTLNILSWRKLSQDINI
ncbi:Mfa1 family fimbria major subunit [Phocaeicola sp.]